MLSPQGVAVASKMPMNATQQGTENPQGPGWLITECKSSASIEWSQYSDECLDNAYGLDGKCNTTHDQSDATKLSRKWKSGCFPACRAAQNVWDMSLASR